MYTEPHPEQTDLEDWEELEVEGVTSTRGWVDWTSGVARLSSWLTLEGWAGGVPWAAALEDCQWAGLVGWMCVVKSLGDLRDLTANSWHGNSASGTLTGPLCLELVGTGFWEALRRKVR